jgi:uncharacterized protein YegP (UPF0339 family)
MKVVITESVNDGQFYPVFVAGNGEPWFWAEGYTQRSDAERSVNRFVAELREVFQNLTIEHVDAQGNSV